MSGSEPHPGSVGPAAGRPVGKPFRVEVKKRGHNAVIKLYGSAGIYECDKIRKPLEELAAQKVPVTVLDLSEMDFIGSAGLSAVVCGHIRNRHHHGQIRLVAPQQGVLEVLQMTCLTKIFPIYSSVDQALAYLERPRGKAATEA
jgi:anti-sigma B factor antagonist